MLTNPQPSTKRLSETELETLRLLLLGPEYKELLQHKQMLENPERLSEHLCPAISQALQLRAKQDGSLQKVLNPLITGALLDSVSEDPKPIADALYPVMGPAIRKSINSTMSQMLNTFNELLEQSVSPKAWRWRFDAWRTGRSYAEVVLMQNLVFQVEQVFLIHKETGLLLQHLVADTAISKDPDMVSGMLTAIQDFISDSFSVEQNSGLDSLRLGDLTVLVEHGPSAVLAVVVRGPVPQGLQETLSETIEDIHQKENQRLKQYDGDPAQFEHLRPILTHCLKTQTRNASKNEQKKSKKTKNTKLTLRLLWICLPLLILALAYGVYYSSNKQANWEALQRSIQSESGLILTQAVKQNGEYHLYGLADPLAIKPMELVTRSAFNDEPLQLAFKPYLSLESDIVLKRLNQALLIPNSVNLTLQNGILTVKGSATTQWIAELKQKAPMLAGINIININQLRADNGS